MLGDIRQELIVCYVLQSAEEDSLKVRMRNGRRKRGKRIEVCLIGI